MPARRCGICSAVGHNRQTCPQNRREQTSQRQCVQEVPERSQPKEYTWCGKTGKWIEAPSAASDLAPLTPHRSSQSVHESKTLTPEGNHETIALERLSTGGTRYAAEFKRSSTGAMSDAERRKKARLRASLFPEKRAESLRTNAERMHTARIAHDSPAPLADTAVSDADSDTDSTSNESDCSEADRLMDRIDSGVEHEAAVKQLHALRARQFAPKCDCSVLTEWGVCKRPACFDWDAASPAPRVGGGMRVRCHTCGTVRCSANCGLLIFNCCEHDHGNLNADYTINGEIRDAIEELLDASPDASCTLQELRGLLLQRGSYGKMQVPPYRQRMAGIDFPCSGGRYYVHLDWLRMFLSNPEDTGAGPDPV